MACLSAVSDKLHCFPGGEKSPKSLQATGTTKAAGTSISDGAAKPGQATKPIRTVSGDKAGAGSYALMKAAGRKGVTQGPRATSAAVDSVGNNASTGERFQLVTELISSTSHSLHLYVVPT